MSQVVREQIRDMETRIAHIDEQIEARAGNLIKSRQALVEGINAMKAALGEPISVEIDLPVEETTSETPAEPDTRQYVRGPDKRKRKRPFMSESKDITEAVALTFLQKHEWVTSNMIADAITGTNTGIAWEYWRSAMNKAFLDLARLSKVEKSNARDIPGSAIYKYRLKPGAKAWAERRISRYDNIVQQMKNKTRKVLREKEPVKEVRVTPGEPVSQVSGHHKKSLLTQRVSDEVIYAALDYFGDHLTGAIVTQKEFLSRNPKLKSFHSSMLFAQLVEAKGLTKLDAVAKPGKPIRYSVNKTPLMGWLEKQVG